MAEQKVGEEQRDTRHPSLKRKATAALGLDTSLAGLVAIVTGSSTGVGAACAKDLARRGCDVVINYNNSKEAAEEVATECRKWVRALVVQADVSSEADCRRLVEEAVASLGRIDLLVNNAGTTKFCPHADLDGLTGEDFTRIYQTNTVSAFNMIKFCAPHMRSTGSGRVVNVASHAGVYHTIGSSLAYMTSKAALVALTKALAKVLGPAIRVNALCPGFIEGEWLKKGIGEERYNSVKGSLEEKLPLAAVSTPELVSENLLWLLTAAPNITGEAVVMDAGFGLLTGPAL
uniref:Uncharacterized protein n=1 Tax=Pyrodinium bahamense TaxID=73915 RepID=A0A7S0AKB3_9DINO